MTPTDPDRDVLRWAAAASGAVVSLYLRTLAGNPPPTKEEWLDAAWACEKAARAADYLRYVRLTSASPEDR